MNNTKKTPAEKQLHKFRNHMFKTIKLDGKEWLKLTKSQAARLGLESCWDDGLLVDCDGYYTGMTKDTIYYNCHPEGRTPVCSYYEWRQCAKATDELVDILVAPQQPITHIGN